LSSYYWSSGVESFLQGQAKEVNRMGINRSEASTLLAKAIAYSNVGNLERAAEYVFKLNEYLMANL
jgi:hypothetical protein